MNNALYIATSEISGTEAAQNAAGEGMLPDYVTPAEEAGAAMNSGVQPPADIATSNFPAPGYQSGTDLPPLPVENIPQEAHNAAASSDFTTIITILIILLIIIAIICAVIYYLRKNDSKKDEVTGLSGMGKETVKIKRKKESLATPDSVKKCVRGFIDNTRNL